MCDFFGTSSILSLFEFLAILRFQFQSHRSRISISSLYFFNIHTETGEVYTWGWKECVPSGKVFHDSALVGSLQNDATTTGKQSSLPADQGISEN